jgi:hypothetical protein
MTDAENNTETEAVAKPESTPKKKAAAKPKAKAKPKTAAKTEAKNKTNIADVAPYKKSHSMPETSHDASAKRRSATTLTLLLVVAILIPTTIYKFNEELNSMPVQADSQEKTADAEPASTATMQEKPESSVSNDAATKSDTTPVQDTLTSNKNTHELAMAQAQERMTSSRELMQQRRQAYEKEMLLKQQEYKAIIEAHRQERAKIAERQKMEAQRIKQYHLETRKKVYEIQRQIFELNEKIKQIMQESYTQRNP